MTQFLRLAESQPERFTEKYLAAEAAAEENRVKEFAAAVKIQSWWRGHQQRSAIEKWKRSAVLIQKMWRGQLARNHYDELVRESLIQKRLRQFNQVATTIQAAWRGYRTRRKVLDFYARKAHMEELERRNQEIRREVEEFEVEQDRLRQEQLAEMKKQKHLKQLQQQHYMLSTASQKGVISQTFGNDAEMTVRAVTRLRNLQDTLKKKYTPKSRFPTLESTQRAHEHYSATQPSSEIQGPFLPSDTLRKIKTKELRSTLARQEEYMPPINPKDVFIRSNPEDDQFRPYASARDLRPKKEASIFTHSCYLGDGPGDTRCQYGRTTFRDTAPAASIDKKAFSTTVKGVTFFDED